VQEELAAYQQIIDDYRDEPSLREQVELATAAFDELGGATLNKMMGTRLGTSVFADRP
jgi:hypothetical protein